MCNKAVKEAPRKLRYVPDNLKSQGMCKKAFEKNTRTLQYVLNHFKTQEMCERAVEENIWSLVYVPDQYKTQEMCDKAVEEDPWLLKYVPDNFKKQKMKAVKKKSIQALQKTQAQKAKIKEDLMPIALHPSRWCDWCVPEDEKRDTEKLWA